MKKYFLLGVATTAILLFFSCKKEQGCTDASAKNHSNYAEEDDGSCEYEGQVYFYYSYAEKSNFEDDGITTLELYVDGEFAGIQKTDVAVVSLGCNGDQNVTKTFDLGGSREGKALLVARNQDTGTAIYSTEFDIYAANCVGVKIAY